MKKAIFLWAILLLFLSACGPSAGAPPEASNTPLFGELTFAGSTTVQPLAGALGEAFQERHPDVRLNIAAGGTRVGIQAIHDGTVDIGMASRALSAEEAQGITVHVIALDVIAIVVHPSNPLDDLDMETLAAIYRGEVTNWNQIGGPDLEIAPIARETSSGTRGAFDELVLGGEEPVASGLLTAVTAGDMAAMVATRPGAIGYVGFGNITSNLKVLAIDGVAPSSETARSGEYPLVRPLSLLTGPLSQPLADEFINFVLSPEGQQIVEEAGWIPVR